MNKFIKLFLAAALFSIPVFLSAQTNDLFNSYEAKLNKKQNKNLGLLCKNLIKAVKNNDLQAVKKFVYAGADINCVDSSGHSPIFYVFEGNKQDNTEIASFLLDGTPVFNSKEGKIQKADLSLKSSYSPNAGCYMVTLMMNDRLDLFEDFLSAGLSPDVRCGKNNAPLLSHSILAYEQGSAAKERYEESFKILMEKGANLFIEDAYGNIPLHYAVIKALSMPDFEMLKEGSFLQMLLSKPFQDAQIHMQNAEGFTPLMFSISRNRGDYDFNVLKYLAGYLSPCSGEKCKIDVLKTEKEGQTVYMLAAKSGVYPFCIVQTYLRPGANVLDNNGKRAVDYIDRIRYPNINEIDCLKLFGDRILSSGRGQAL